ncbi:MAG: hypothetical protein AAF363_07975 [Bacteroidota bacterium]
MKKITVLTLILLLHFTTYAQIPRKNIKSNDDIVIQTVKPDSLGHPNAAGYLEYLPDGYDTAKRYPLIVFLHGRGERGNGNTELFEVADLGLPNFIEFGVDLCPGPSDLQDECFIVISPQLKTTVDSWGINVINHVFEFAIEKYKVDTNRIFLSGHSLGGIGTYNYAGNSNKYNYSLTGIIPVAANSIDATEGCRISERKINVRAYHSQADSTVKFPGGKRSFDNIKNCTSPIPEADLRFIEYASLTHNATVQQGFRESDRDSTGMNVYDWLFNVGLPSDTINDAPSANAGADLTLDLPIDSVVIDGSGTDPDGDDLNFLWSQISGTPLILSDIDTDDLLLTNLQEGSFSFVLQVNDPDGLSDTDTVNLALNPPAPQPPVASAGTDLVITLPQDSVLIDGTGSDADSDSLFFSWSQTSGASAVLSGVNEEDLFVSSLSEGTFTFELVVTDSDGLSDADQVQITVLSEPDSTFQINEKVTDKKGVRYLEYLPPGYDSTQIYPILIYFHSDEVEGTDIELIKDEGPLYFITKENKSFCFDIDGTQQCFIVISPQIEVGSGFFKGKVNAVYDQIEKDYTPDDIYLSGFDEGGQAIYSRILDENDPNRYSGIAVIGARPSTVSNSAEDIGRLNPKILIGHGENDSERSFSDALDYYNEIRASITGSDTLFASFTGASHEQSMLLAFDPTGSMNIYEWMFNDGGPTLVPPVADAGEDVSFDLPLDSAVVLTGTGSDPDGSIDAYLWSQISGDPLIISNINTRFLIVDSLVAGTFEFTFEVTDDDGLTDVDSVVLTVNPAPELVGTIEKKETDDSRRVPYLEYLPAAYDSTANYPVLVYLHSDEVAGTELDSLKNEGPFYYISQNSENFCFEVDGTQQCFIVIAPQVDVGSGFFRGKVNAVYNQIVEDYEPDEIYLTGFDEGAGSIYARLLDNDDNPNQYAGVAIIGARTSRVNNAATDIGLLNPKILIGHGDLDAKRSYSEALDFYNDIRSSITGSDTLFVTFDGDNHEQSLESAFDPGSSRSIYEWLFNDQTVSAQTRISNGQNSSEILDEKLNSGTKTVNYLYLKSGTGGELNIQFYPESELLLFNQSGQMVFQGTQENIEGSFKRIQNGVYIYQYRNKDVERIHQKGRIILLD